MKKIVKAALSFTIAAAIAVELRDHVSYWQAHHALTKIGYTDISFDPPSRNSICDSALDRAFSYSAKDRHGLYVNGILCQNIPTTKNVAYLTWGPDPEPHYFSPPLLFPPATKQ